MQPRLITKHLVLDALDKLYSELVRREKEEYTALFTIGAPELLLEFKNAFQEVHPAELEQSFFSDFHNIIECADIAATNFVKDSEESLRIVREALTVIKREMEHGTPLYNDLDKVEKWLKGREEAIYTYLERRF